LARFAFDKLRLTLLKQWRYSHHGVTLSLSKGGATHRTQTPVLHRVATNAFWLT
jgi:hypothetical protein